MSVTAMRRSYHHGDLRHVLMKAAREQIAVEGTEKLSLRALAREAGVSPTAPYRHFPTKNCLLAAIAAEGFAELQDIMQQQVRTAGADVLDQLTASARAYVQYALENPVKFHLMFGSVVADFTPYEALQKNARTAFDAFVCQVNRAREAGVIEPAPLEEIVAYLWSGMHGVASLIINKTQRLEGESLTPSMQSVRFMRDHLDTIVGRFIKGLVVKNYGTEASA